MCLLVESLMIKNGRPCNLEYHQKRFDKTRADLFSSLDEISLEELLETKLLEDQISRVVDSNQLCKCRVVYDTKIHAVEISPYIRRSVKTLKIVRSETVEYAYKYNDRKEISNLFELKGDCDDILIIKNDFVTDTSFSNVLFFDGIGWITPNTYLLPGTKRAKLIKTGVVVEKEVKVIDVSKFTKLRIINALNDFEDEIDIPVTYIFH